MEEILNLISNYGVETLIVGLFLWDWVSNKKSNSEILKANNTSLKTLVETNLNIKKCLENIEKNNDNISKSLDLLQKTMDNQEKKIDKLLDR